MLDSKNIGNTIWKIRKEQSLTQEQLAAICGVGRRFIIELENGKKTCHIGKVLHVLGVLGIDIVLTSRNKKASS